MRKQFLNEITISGYLDESFKDINGVRDRYGFMFSMTVPRNKSNTGNNTKIYASVWGRSGRIAKNILENLAGEKITITGRLTTNVKSDGSWYYVVSVKDFCIDWYNVGAKKEIGEIYKFKLSGHEMKSILEQINSEDI